MLPKVSVFTWEATWGKTFNFGLGSEEGVVLSKQMFPLS